MPKIDPSIFKAYDIRGTYPDQFDEDTAYRIARAYAQFMKPKVTVVGHDMRVSGPSLTDAVIRGLLDQGSNVVNVGLTSTPMYYYSVNAYKGDAGMMLTASHNPGEYNGLKMTGPGAIPSISYISNEDLYKLTEEGNFEEPAKKGVILQTPCPLAGYVETVLKTSGIKDFGNLKIAIDTANGMGGLILPKLLEDKDCTVYPLYFEIDGRFPNHEANPLKEETLADLKKLVLEKGANLGVAFDGDGDRVAFVDEKGQSIAGDIITALIAKEILKDNPGATILYDLRSSWAVKEEIEKAGGKAVMCRVGHGLIKRQMREMDAVFAGELSSHYYFRDFYTTDNGDLAMLKILQLMVDENIPLSEMAAPIMRYSHSPEINSKVKDVNAKLKEIKERYKNGRIIELDGLTVEFDDWWFNVRPSQTEPLLRLNVEATTKEKMDEKVAELLNLIRS
ncbi:MAG: phosphomannomutase/phosphoglucomutase [Armatimonadota bacterium]|jgi:phosphomannomutase